MLAVNQLRKRYGIAGIVLEVSGVELPECWKPFELSKEGLKADFKISAVLQEAIVHGTEYYRFSSRPVHILKMGQDILMADKKWKEAEVFPVSALFCAEQLFLQMFYTQAVRRRMVQLHSSFIHCCGRGVLLLGPSGIGKTTQAELWNQYRGAEIINGDLVFAQETEKNVWGWGTPWHGSSDYCRNQKAPLSAIVVLKQAETNSIRKLTGFEKLSEVSKSVFYPRWLENGMELCMEVLDHLLKKLPVYELACLPDEGAVSLTEKTIFGE